MKYQANPVIVEAQVIQTVGEPDVSGNILITVEGDHAVTISAGHVARYVPQPGDYFVTQEDGYTYVNPKAVFERKYSQLATESEFLHGSSVQPSHFTLKDGMTVQLGTVVAAAQKKSGLTALAWNSQPDYAREEWIKSALNELDLAPTS